MITENYDLIENEVDEKLLAGLKAAQEKRNELQKELDNLNEIFGLQIKVTMTI